MKRKAWKKMIATFLAAVCLPLGSLSVPAVVQASDAAEVSVEVDGSTVTIGNSYISREFSTAGNKLKTTAITNKRTDGGDTVFTPAEGSEEFKIRVAKINASDNTEREFVSSQLELSGEPTVEDTNATINNVEKTGKKVTFRFEPYTFKDVDYTISEVIVMYNGDNFMRKYMEIGVPENKKENAVIDYIDLESLVVNENDATWTIPTDAGGVVQMNQFRANLGQPIYIQGMFFGCEFPAADTEIVSGTGYMRYYTGKSFDRLEQDNQLTQDGKYVTWQTVAGAARSTENAVIQADFFDYIKSIATPSEFRIQYNSWFDNMMLISDEIILDSFVEMDRELNKAEVRPLDSYVVDDGWVNYNHTGIVDAARAGTTLNQSGFWEFNSKFPHGLTPSSELVHNFGSNFGVWVGPRGGYNFFGSLANILTESGKGSKAGGSIDVADRVYVENFTEMAVNWMEEYGVNYWKWDGFADNAQYDHFPAADGVPGYANRHMTGGYDHMYHVTDLWEAWIDLMETVRQAEKDYNIKNLWISLTCYVNPSPWYLQWANSVWIQCTADQADAGPSTSKMDRQMTYRDACYYDFLKNHEFQFPLSNLYNHDPVYGVEGTGMDINTATDEQFKNYLYMLATRGSAFWELYFSDSIMTDEKYEITGEFLEWAEENYHMLKNSKMFGASPNTGTVLGGSGGGTQNAYGYACFDGTDGIISFRNSANTAKDITVTFDRTIGVPEDAGTLKYHMEHSHNLTSGTPTVGELTYGDEITYTLQPDEVRILRVSKEGDTTAPEIIRAYSDGANEITLKFNEKVTGSTFKVNGTEVSSAKASADGLTFRLTVEEGTLEDKSTVTVTAEDVSDLAGNPLQEKSVSFIYRRNNMLLKQSGLIAGESTAAAAEDSLIGNNGFSVSAEVYTESVGAVLSQGNEYAIGILEDGKAYFILNGVSAVSKTSVNDGEKHTITGVKENNGMLKIYIDGQLEGAGYKEENRYYEVKAADVVVGNDDFYGIVNAKTTDTAKGYDIVEEESGSNPEVPTGETNWASGKTVTAKWTSDNTNAAKGGDCPMSRTVDGTKNSSTHYGEFGADNRSESSYMEVDLGDVRNISKINLYRYWSDGRTYNGTVIAVSETQDFAEKEIVYNSDKTNFHGLGAGSDDTYAESADGKTIELAEPVSARYVRVYMYGSNKGTTNHVVELEVIGTQPIPDADYTAVDEAIKIAESLKAEDYKAFTAVTDAVAAVDRSKDATEQAAVNEMAANIYKAITNLERTADKILSDALENAESKNLYGYTAETARAFQNILFEAKKIKEDASVSDAAKIEAARNIRAAIDTLKKLSPEDLAAQEAAKKNLAGVIKQAEAYTDASKYTSDSWQAFGKALEAAKSIWSGISTKAEYEEALKALNEAISKLTPASDNPIVTPPEETKIQENGIYENGNYKYKVTSLSKKTVEVAGTTNPKLKKVKIGNTVKLGEENFRITSIQASAFKNNKNITSVSIGKNVAKIGDSAFEKCSKLTKVTVNGNSLTQIGKKAFMNCKKLKNVTVKSKKVKKIGKNAFKGIPKKAKVKIPKKKK